jgi:uncharacterized protein involved in exopolysaccharide biosynthesis
MSDRQDREEWRRERSLLALGQAMRGDEPAPTADPLLSSAGQAGPSWQQDAAARHRLARSRREVLADEEPVDAERSELIRTTQDEGPSGLTDRLSRWLRPGRAETAADTPAPRPASAASACRNAPLGLDGADFRHRAVAEPATDYREYAAHRPDSGQQWQPLIDPMKVVGGVARSKWLIVAMTILGAALGVAIALSTPKKYEATAELIVDPRDLKLTDSDLTQSLVASDATLAIVENKVRVLTSGAVLNKVVDELNLVDDPEFNGQGGGLGVLSFIRSLLSRDDGPGGADEGRRRALTVGNLAESLTVERGGKTFVITIGVTTRNGEKSALIANTMTDIFLQTYGEIQSDTASRANEELTARLDELRKGVEAAERKVEDFRATHDLVDAQGHLISDDELLKLNEQLSVARAHTLELSARAASARGLNVDSVLGGTLPEEINSATMADLRSQYATLKQEADRAAVRLGPRHPERQALDAQLAGARDRIGVELRRIASSLQVELRRAVQLDQQLASRLAQLKVRSGDVNSDLVTLRELEREASAKRSVYEAFLLRAKQTSEQKDINTANMSVISKAFAPLEPNGPSRAVMALAGLLLGFASGIGLGAMRGAYESLRETADKRSRRPGRSDPPRLLEGDGGRLPAESAPLVDFAPDPRRGSGPVGALLSAIRRAMPRRTNAAEAFARPRQVAETTPAETSRPREVPMPPIDPGAVRQPPRSGDPGFRQGAHASRLDPPPPAIPREAAYLTPVQPHPQAQPWLMQPMPYSDPRAYPPQPPSAYPQSWAAPADPGQPASAEGQATIEEIRASLREFRDAVRELTESRSRRRYF